MSKACINCLNRKPACQDACENPERVFERKRSEARSLAILNMHATESAISESVHRMKTRRKK